jgi:hypothetical protein
MATYPSARGQKPAEVANRPEGRNTIVTIWVSGGNAQTAWGPDYESAAGQLTVEQALDATIVMGRTPLLWTYATPDANYTELKFGFDDPIGANKIGHVAMASEATISGEIFRSGGHWRINNESGAWGNMGGHGGKTQKLQQAAAFMTAQCGGMQVVADHAYSRKGLKRKIQQLFR